ncbi:AraC family transcriptional regulator [Pelagovum pacificum]|uniref:AraC family transcriptional regulator n=1 Tax=Pelagovum pacificum TaxID=2588711 RepID=A0A5C5GCR0_9RHOB|nr:AraC family transcriptional regulator [Pelagovum pacificum]QQA42295.1 AraC family transcriptional regulator [Pelagovum pacificum]TNY31379.1 AraC family transcriptional regulator [Pelagovum pacificum]
MKERLDMKDPVVRALWQVETDLDRVTDLGALAASVGVSRFHLTRAFTLRAGQPPMRYVRARRLTLAARALASGRENVTGAGLLAGYDSSEGFSRAFRAWAGVAPSSIRSPSDLDNLPLQEPLTMTLAPITDLDPRIVTSPPVTLAGKSWEVSMETRGEIPGYWDAMIEEWEHLMSKEETYGICHDFQEDGRFGYFIGFPCETPPDGLGRFRLPGATYAVFDHAGHVSGIAALWDGIFSDWAPKATVKVGTGPEFELYEEGYDPATPGGVAVWIPLEG